MLWNASHYRSQIVAVAFTGLATLVATTQAQKQNQPRDSNQPQTRNQNQTQADEEISRRQDPTRSQGQQPTRAQNSRQLPGQGQQHGQGQRSRWEEENEHFGESPALGAIISSCPGNAVCITDTIWGSPADQAGLRAGDYILSLNNQKVTSPTELKRRLQELDSSESVTLTVWREGREINTEVDLAKESKELPQSHKAWLGVMLAPNGEEGISVERIFRDSPAERAGIREGDVLVKINDQPIESVEQVVEKVEDLGPGTAVQLTVKRNGTEQSLSVELGSVEEAPTRWYREAYASSPGGNWGDSRMGAPDEVIERTLDDIRRQLRTLQQQVNAMQRGESASGSPGSTQQDRTNQPESRRNPQRRSNERDENQDNANRETQPDDNTQSSYPVEARADSNPVQLVVQNSRYRGSSRSYGNWNRNNSYRHGHYHYGRPYSSYRSPYYRSPSYGNYYYRYGGRPYYQSGWGNYGPRYGIGISPGLGIYW